MPATLLKKRLWHRCFPVKFVKVLRTTFFIERLSWLLLLLVAQVAIEKRMCMNIVFLYFYGMRLIINQIRIKLLLSTIRSSHSQMFCKIVVLKNSTKFTENHLGTCNFNKNSTQILPVNFAKLLRTPLLQNTSVRLLLTRLRK